MPLPRPLGRPSLGVYAKDFRRPFPSYLFFGALLSPNCHELFRDHRALQKDVGVHRH